MPIKLPGIKKGEQAAYVSVQISPAIHKKLTARGKALTKEEGKKVGLGAMTLRAYKLYLDTPIEPSGKKPKKAVKGKKEGKKAAKASRPRKPKPVLVADGAPESAAA